MDKRNMMTIYMILVGAKEGAPEGPIYAMLMGQGVTLAEFEAARTLLVDKGAIKSGGFVLSIKPKGKAILDSFEAALAKAREEARG